MKKMLYIFLASSIFLVGCNTSLENRSENKTNINFEFEENIEHKGFDCEKLRTSEDEKTAVYGCVDTSLGEVVWDNTKTLVKTDKGDLIEIFYSFLYDDPGNWEESFAIPGNIRQISETLYFTDIYTGGAHCCSVTYIIDYDKGIFTDQIFSGSAYLVKDEEFENQNIFYNWDPGFEYFWGPYVAHVSPLVYYEINDLGSSEVINPELSDEKIEELINQLEEDFKTFEAKYEGYFESDEIYISNKDDVCEKYQTEYVDKQNYYCNNHSQEARVLAAQTATYLLADRDIQAEEFFFSKVNDTEQNRIWYQEIVDNIS